MANRLFLAVRPPPGVAAELDAFVEPRRDAEPGLRWVHPEHWHLTLAFLGQVDEPPAEAMAENLEFVAAGTVEFNLTVGGAGGFPHPDAARALWLDVPSGAAELDHLAQRCRTAAARAGIHVAGGRFRPHLTIARSRGIDTRRWLPVIDSFGSFSWRVTEFLLVDSELTRGGPRHRISRRFDLASGERMLR